MSFDPQPINLAQALLHWGAIVACLLGFALVVSWLLSLVMYGPRGFVLVLKGFAQGLDELFTSSPRRIWALTSLATKESFRRKAWQVMVVFAVLFLFAGWFLSKPTQDIDLQVKNYVSFVLTAISWLILPSVFLLACWSLPDDIKARSLHTVVTKPVRRSEVLLGRVLGITLVGTVALVVMGTFGYIWLRRSLPPDNTPVLVTSLTSADLESLRAGREVAGTDAAAAQIVKDLNPAQFGQVTQRRIVEFVQPGTGKTIRVQPASERDGGANAPVGDVAVYEIVRKEKLIARVPQYGRMTFLDREGKPADKGVNTGDIWEFRSYIEGNTKARAIWEFDNVSAGRFGDKLRLESSFQVFRTFKGDIDAGILCRYVFVNDAKKIRAPYTAFPVKEFRENLHEINRKLFDEQNRPVDLFDDLVDNGKLKIEVQCLTSGQFLGAARPDLFIRLPDAPFVASFSKSVFGIWEMMFLMVVMGVVASCFVKGPVATLLTLFVLIVGRLSGTLLKDLTSVDWKGGGAIESAYRILTHMNPTTELPKTLFTNIMKGIDAIPQTMLQGLKYLLPNFKHFNLAEYSANGFDVPWDAALLPGLVMTIGYVIPCLVLGYFSLKMRELESK